MIVKIWARSWPGILQHKTDSRIEAKKKGSYDPLIYVGVFISPYNILPIHPLQCNEPIHPISNCNALNHSNATNV
jgi:hypothetical protein